MNELIRGMESQSYMVISLALGTYMYRLQQSNISALSLQLKG